MKKESEDHIQQECLVWYNLEYCTLAKNPRGVCYSIPNEGAMQMGREIMGQLKGKVSDLVMKIIQKTTGIMTHRLKLTGMKEGVSDTHIILPNGKILFIEFKTSTGYQSKEQKDFQQVIENLGHTYLLVRNLKEFQYYIRLYEK